MARPALPARRLAALLLAAPLLGSCATTSPSAMDDDAVTPTPEQSAELLDLVQRAFDAIRDGDPAAWDDLLLQDGGFTAFDSASRSARFTSFDDLRGRAAGEAGRYLERCWDPRILIEGDLTMIWTPYDFHIDGRFSHSGVDVFTVVHTADGWRIASIAYTVDREQRDDNPLPPVAAPEVTP